MTVMRLKEPETGAATDARRQADPAEVYREEICRDEVLALMDQLEDVVMKRGWPVPFSPYYLVNHDSLLRALDRMRAGLLSRYQDDRLISAFGKEFNQEKGTRKR